MGHESTNPLLVLVSYCVAALGLYLILGTLRGVSITGQHSKFAAQTKEENQWRCSTLIQHNCLTSAAFNCWRGKSLVYDYTEISRITRQGLFHIMVWNRFKLIFICTVNNLSLLSIALVTQEVWLRPRYFQLFFLQLHRFEVERMNNLSKELCFSLWPDTQLWPTTVTKCIYKINFVEKVQWS